jgi:hypothetical protein
MSEIHAPNFVWLIFFYIVIEQRQWRHENGSEQISEPNRALSSKEDGTKDGCWLAGCCSVNTLLCFCTSCFSVQMEQYYKYRLAHLAAR